MLVMAVLLMAGTTFLTISSTESQIAANQRASTQAFLVAEAAIHKAIVQLNANQAYSGETTTALGGTFTVSVVTAAVQRCPAATAKDLTATGVVPVGGGQAQAQIRVTVDQISYPFRWAAFAAVPNQVVVDDRIEKELWIEENGSVDSFDSSLGAYDATTNRGSDGDIGANGDITLDNNVQVYGSVRAGDALHKGSNVSVTGTQATSVPGEQFPALAPATAPTTDLTVSSGTHTLAAGTYYYTAMTFANNTSLAISGGPVTIYVTGDVSIGQNVTLGSSPGTQLRIIAKSDGGNTDHVSFDAGNNFTLYGVLYGKNADVTIGENTAVYGAIIGRTFLARQPAAIHYDQAMSNQEVCHSGKYTFRRGTWREIIP